MLDSKRVRGNIGARGKRRFVTKTKWELPFRDSKPYWDKICEDIESKVLTRVRNSSSNPLVYPIIFPPSIRYSAASSVSRDDTNINGFSKRHLATKMVHSSVSKTILKAPQSSKPSDDSITSTELPQESINFPSELFKDFTDHSESSNNHWRLTRLSKLARLVNDFLSRTNTRVRPISLKSKNFSSSGKKSRAKNRNDKSILTREKSVDDRSKIISSECESTIVKKTRNESKEEAGIGEDAILEKKSVAFRDDLEENLEKDSQVKADLVSVTKPQRTRAPSLSIASALPSFGRVVISIEDVDSTENEEDSLKSKDHHCNSPNVMTSRDYRKMMNPDEPEVDDAKPKKDFLRVPEIRLTGSASYPSHDKSKFSHQNLLNETRQAKESHESELRNKSRMLQKKHGLWPKRSLVHVFHALKKMKNGLRSKARMQLETNKFFASPLDIYSPSARSSISSEDRNDFMGANGPESELNDETIAMEKNDENGSMEKIDSRESDSSSYTSVRERLMRNVLANLPKDSLRYAPGTSIDTDNVLEATSERTNPSSFYNSWDTIAKKIVAKPPNRKILERYFIGIPRMAKIFPRVKGDKCHACMYKSLGDIDQTRRHKIEGTILDYGNEIILDDDDEQSGILACDFSISGTLDHFYRNRPLFSSDESLREDHSSRSLIHDEDSSKNAEKPETFVQEASIESSRTVQDSHRSRTIVKSGSKPLISVKSLITSLSLVTERSRSISDQDDSDQGCTDPVKNDISLGGGSTSKNLAPCHMPINLKPSLEPLKALRSKKSRSIRSRVASAEKSFDSADEDDEDNNYDSKIVKQPMNIAKKKLEADSIKLGVFGSPNNENSGETSEKEDTADGEKSETDKTRSFVESLAVSSKIDDIKNDSSDLPIISDREVIVISAKCLENDKTITEILEILAKEYSKRLTERLSMENNSQASTNARKKEKMAIKLLTLLVDSKNYLNREKWSNDFSHVSFSSKQPGCNNSRQLRRILPLKSYNLVAPILGMAKWYPSRRINSLREIAKRASRIDQRDKPEETAFDLIVHPPSVSGERVTFEKSWKDNRPKLNPYSLFLMKPRRKAVTWRPLTERDVEGYDPEATLKMRAAKITDRICEDFCQWLESLAAGTNQTSGIDVHVLKDMFETDFTAEVCSTMQVAIREMPMVPIAVAIARNCPDAGELALTRKHLANDAKAEMRPKKIIGFGTSLRNRFKFVPPRNRIEEKWLQCENVPKDLETMEAVWKDITHLNSVKGFINWLRAHPQVKRPKALEQVLTAKEIMTARQSIVNRFTHLELDLDQIQSLKVGDNASDAY